MRRAALFALAAMLVAARDPGPTYTRASVAPLSTAELAALFLDPADAATIEGHWIGEALTPSDYLEDIHFIARPRPLGLDICGRDTLHVNLRLADPADCRGRIDPPVRAEPAVRETRIALALAAARAATAGSGPLPFRLRCGIDGEHPVSHPCPSDLRGLLAGLPLHRILSIDRPPFMERMLCGPMPPMTGDSVEIDAEVEGLNDGSIWEVRLRDWGTGGADITFNRAPRWNSFAC
jgi:hypothetical protein